MLSDDPVRAGNLVHRIRYAVFEPLMIAVALMAPLPDRVSVRAPLDEKVPLRRPASLPSSSDHTLLPISGEHRDAIRAAHAAIAPMLWGSRVALDDACEAIRSWTAEPFQ